MPIILFFGITSLLIYLVSVYKISENTALMVLHDPHMKYEAGSKMRDIPEISALLEWLPTKLSLVLWIMSMRGLLDFVPMGGNTRVALTRKGYDIGRELLNRHGS